MIFFFQRRENQFCFHRFYLINILILEKEAFLFPIHIRYKVVISNYYLASYINITRVTGIFTDAFNFLSVQNQFVNLFSFARNQFSESLVTESISERPTLRTFQSDHAPVKLFLGRWIIELCIQRVSQTVRKVHKHSRRRKWDNRSVCQRDEMHCWGFCLTQLQSVSKRRGLYA